MQPRPKTIQRLAGAVFATLYLAGCASSAISPETRDLALPEQWQQAEASQSADPTAQWLSELASPDLESLVAEAQAGNYQLALSRARAAELKAAVTSTGAPLWPALTLSVDGGRDGLESEQSADLVTESWRGSLGISWELDIWGKLSDRQRQAELNYHSSLADLRSQQLQLAADVATGWFNAIANARLEALLEQRLANVSTDLARLEQGYRRGLNAALDVYLSRNTVADSRANLAQQQQSLLESRTALQRSLARYPDGDLAAAGLELPELVPVTAAGTPAQLLERRPDVQQAWLDLLAADAGLAAAHKDRFPSFSLVGSAGGTSGALHGLLDAGLTSWSISAGLTQPLFEGGRLKSLEEQARARVSQAEQAYLDAVFNAMAEVENLLGAEQNLRTQLAAQRESRRNADIAYELSLQQYQRGLVDYTTVLESQRRAFDAQTAAIQSHAQAIVNRITLYRALGGNFALPEPTTT
ncbi:TolC family protein [Parahaliea maris]|uniref:TolC family protein n=1 Tax=Parahaliea maris TaxID=2716870 RepID=A0A5C8ZZV2_9GAMM|nr:TolC family protein [Parahaliea maris]TXS94018.1 TolC family protein [Parahaliea maris]